MSLKFKRNYKIVLTLLIVVLVLVFGFGEQRVIAYTTQAQIEPVSSATDGTTYTNSVDLFDDTVVHSIQVLISQDDYDTMVKTYQETNLKEYYKADVIIDGIRINDVGFRLKGNASLGMALGGQVDAGNAGMMGNAGGGMPPAGFQMPADGQMPTLPDGMQPPDGFEMPADGQMPQPPDGMQGGMPGGMGGMAQSSSGEVKIPFMIKFDEYIDGQTYQGYTNLAVRTYGTSYNEAMLEEPLTNDMADLVGLPATQTAFSGFSINDASEELYVISEIVNEGYLEKQLGSSDGVLYKAEVGATLAYQGEEPSAYTEMFTQQTQLNEADMSPLIDFMRFLEESDDATFEQELPKRLDIDSFAAYLALNNLLVNTDSMLGMNNNYYLYYNTTTSQFTLLLWDANESMGGMANGPTASGGSSAAEYDLYFSSQTMRGPGGGTNVLQTRFMANSTFKALYEDKLETLYQQIFASGALQADLERYTNLIRSVNPERSLVDLTAYEEAVTSMLDFITQRYDYLRLTDLLKNL